jgi:hypothetical protein
VIETWGETKKTDHLEADILEKLKKETQSREQAQLEEQTIIKFAKKDQSPD